MDYLGARFLWRVPHLTVTLRANQLRLSMTYTILPVNPHVYWGFVTLIVVASLFLVAFLLSRYLKSHSLKNLKISLGLEFFNDGLLLVFITMWALLFVVLFACIIWTAYSILRLDLPTDDLSGLAYGSSIAQLAAFAAVMAAIIATPVTLRRLELARKEGVRDEARLYEAQIVGATSELSAMRESETTKKNGEQVRLLLPDYVRRQAAADCLFEIVDKFPSLGERVVRLLSYYLREESYNRNFPEIPSVRVSGNNKISPEAEYPDMENVAVLLGQIGNDEAFSNLAGHMNLSRTSLRLMYLPQSHFEGARFYASDLRSANLRGANLKNVDFSSALLTGALLEGANLDGVMFDYLTELSAEGRKSTRLKGACFRNMTFFTAEQASELDETFGDGSVLFSPNIAQNLRPSHWPQEVLSDEEYYRQWARWKDKLLPSSSGH